MVKDVHWKKIAVRILVTLISVFAFSVSVSAEELMQTLRVEYTLPNGFAYTVNAFEKSKTATDGAGNTSEDREYSIVLPYQVKGTEVTVFADGTGTFEVDGKKYVSGEKYVLESGGHTVAADGKEYNLNIFYTSDLPQIYIETDKPLEYVNENKENETSGSVVITDGTEVYYSGGMDVLKGRGNVSWFVDKKPYSIKLSNKVSLFGMEPSRKYNLLSHMKDEAIVRNAVAVEFAERVGTEYCTQSQFLDLYVNNEYLGIYQLTEKVEVANGRVEIFDVDVITEESNRGVDLDSLPQGGEYEKDAASKKGSCKWLEVPNDIAKGIDGGYLLELELKERYYDAKAGFVTDYGQVVVVKSPEYASEAQIKYISSYYQEFEDAVLSADGFNSLGRHYSEYIDMESMARMYLLQEFIQNLDAGLTSAYLYKDVNGKLAMCAPWDFDHSLGDDAERDGYILSNPENIWVAKGHLFNQKEYTVFSLLWQHPEFRREAARQWKTIFRPEIQWLSEMQQDVADSIYDSAVIDYYKWRRTAYINPQQASEIYLEEISNMADYIVKRAEFLDRFLAEDAVYVQYSANGGKGFSSDKNTYMPGDKVWVRYCDYVNEDGQGTIEFLGWNTQPDGSGTAYRPEDTFTISEDVMLYAQWSRQNGQESPVQGTADNTGLFGSIIKWFRNLFK